MAMLRPLCRDRVVGLDFSRGMLDVCRRNTATAPGSARLEYVRGDALTLPFGPEFDVVTCFGALGHIPRAKERQFVAEVARVLRPGGRFAVVTSYAPPWWSRRYLAARLFNVAMAARNVVVVPPFVMFYLTFQLPGIRRLLQEQELTVEERELGMPDVPAEWRIVIASRPLSSR
jgi:ubiquinone/menaquinone biosynthesis C-methylase UbiE